MDYLACRLGAALLACHSLPTETLQAAPLGHAAEWFATWCAWGEGSEGQSRFKALENALTQIAHLDTPDISDRWTAAKSIAMQAIEPK